MAICLISWLAALLGSLLLDATVRPRRRRGLGGCGLIVHLLIITGAFGLFLAGSGSGPVSAGLVLALFGFFTTVSNAKYAMLGEPLLFSDLALMLAIIRHPRFYLTAVPMRQRWGFAVGTPILILILALLFVPRWQPHLLGLGMLLSSSTGLVILLRGRATASLAVVPGVEDDLMRHGLIATLLLYWRRWRESADPPPCPALPIVADWQDGAPELVVIVQCESFADPVELTGDRGHALPGLGVARSLAWQWGELSVSGFGAYTMRTEYGVLFGRSEAELGFRRYDPFLTAYGETSYALPARLGANGYRSLFVHPYDMRFYGRDRLMPAIGFDLLVGEESFASLQTGSHRYIGDRTLAASMGELIDKADGPTLIYAVTMENHGPWDKDQLTGSLGGLGAYLHHLGSSDGMLSDLITRLSDAGRTALLVFFGDHRPSIPGVSAPGGARHTPYVVLRFSGDGEIVTGENRRADLSPDELHHAILRTVLAGRDVGIPRSDPEPDSNSAKA